MICAAHAGQAVVQIAEDPRSRLDYALKFFLSEGAFRHEKGLYLDDSQPLGQFLPQLKNVLEEGQLNDAHGHAFPPCIVMEKGESLDVWISQSGSPDVLGCLQERSGSCCRYSAIAGGFVPKMVCLCAQERTGWHGAGVLSGGAAAGGPACSGLRAP